MRKGYDNVRAVFAFLLPFLFINTIPRYLGIIEIKEGIAPYYPYIDLAYVIALLMTSVSTINIFVHNRKLKNE